MRKCSGLFRRAFWLGVMLLANVSVAVAYTGTFTIAPSSSSVNDWQSLGVVQLLPADTTQSVEVSVPIAVTGLRPEMVDDDGDPTTEPVEEDPATYTAALSGLATSLTIDGQVVPVMNGAVYATFDGEASGEIPGTATVKLAVPETAAPGYYGFTVIVISNMTQDVRYMRYVYLVDRAVGDLLTVSPSTINVRIPQSGIGQQTFAVQIANADPDTDPYERAFDWSATTDASWISLSQSRGAGSGVISVIVDPQTLLPATVGSTYSGGLVVGETYTGTITFYSTLTSESRTLTVNATVVPASTLPLQPPTFQQMDPEAMLVTATDAGWVNFQLCATQILTDGSDNADPFNTDYPSSFVTIELPQMLPGEVYALTNKVGGGGLALASQNGVLVSGADSYSYADVPVASVPFGPFQLLGFHGTATVKLLQGATLSAATEVYRVQVNIQTLDGSWRVTENWQGESYTYGPTQMLILAMDNGQITYSGTWGATTAVTVVPGDGYSYLYRLTFSEGGYSYIYEILSLSGDTMTGRYSFSGNGTASGWETFRGQRVVW
ncbi:MAG: hypothetical protein ACOY3Z_10930 [Thermodesulfobacteriota bacterium]